MKIRTNRSLLVSMTVIILWLALAVPALAQETCVETNTCKNGQALLFCNQLADRGAMTRMWYEVGGVVFECGPNFDCTAAANEAVAYCFSGTGGGDTCMKRCGGTCCDSIGTECCNDGCLPADQTCCGGGACEAGLSCCNNACVPEGATCCDDGTYCEAGTCCNRGCIAEGETCCGAGVCSVGETCAAGLCVPVNAVTCGDGSVCPEWTACAGGQCCPEGFASYDAASGYCCGAGPEAGLCACAVSCNGSCCPAGTVCCDGGYCASNADGCPKCPGFAPRFCPDHSCVPEGASCCGGGFYCMNSLTCMDCGGGQTCCGNQSTPANPVNSPANTGGAVPAAIVTPVQPSTKGATPGAPSSSSQAGETPVKIKAGGGGSSGGGCSLVEGRASSGGPLPVVLLLLVLAWIRGRRTWKPETSARHSVSFSM